ncbi:tryptophan-rich sensory protein [Octadecabacter sp. G9-8]|uniref:Tryptophan-rich sensory protein n=1 Tax=Octadecabacter dasysiphoniae TaxID=2909341 RepID=A0ABS9CW91_9RHOB|nr:TspO/MBR family protein [Octadecabacter dasysiphoniae]MCF2871536.1 tryptophan-rich sensory protein [Octadecabacter dasysiphoniae]
MDIILFLIFLAACFSAGATGAMFPPGPWYEQLEKPTWTPPNWLFPVAWTTLYVLMSFAGARVAGEAGSGYAMAFWALQIALNALWTPVFFGLRRLKQAIPIMAMLWVAVAGCMVTHWAIDVWAGLAFVPYLAWVTVAGALNMTVARMNPDVEIVDMTKI